MRITELVEVFNAHGHLIRTPDDKILGRGTFESDLEAAGFTKQELRKFCHSSILKKFQVRHKGGLRNSYVLPLGDINVQQESKKK